MPSQLLLDKRSFSFNNDIYQPAKIAGVNIDINNWCRQMPNIGKFNQLKVVKKLDFGVYLDGEELGNILLPGNEVPEKCKIGDIIEVFILHDAKARLVATTLKPKVELNQFAYLRVITVTPFGAFLDWGLQRNLLVHKTEQKQPMKVGKSYFIFCYLESDEKGSRIAATSKFDKFFDVDPQDYKEGQEVDLLIYEQTDIGFKAIINRMHWGLLYKDEIFHELKPGQQLKGYIKKLRQDNKIDLCLQKPGHEKVGDLSDQIYQKLKEQGGFIKLTDKSQPEEIYEMFAVSKKTFKKAVGALYKRRLVAIDKDGIKLLKPEKFAGKKKK